MIADVIVDLRVRGLDRPLSYRVPDKHLDRVRVGSVVRVPLRNRRVRGWVVDLRPPVEARLTESSSPGGLVGEGHDDSDLSLVASVSGVGPAFDPNLLEMARQLARDLVQPLSSFLNLFTPARLGRPAKLPLPLARRDTSGLSTLRRWGATEDPLATYVPMIESHLELMRGVIVCVPEVIEGSRILEYLADRFSDDVAVVHSGVDPAIRSAALWEVARGQKRLVLGGRAALFAPPVAGGLIIVHQEHDPSYKEQRAPYYDARDVAIARAHSTGSDVLLTSRTPSLWAMSRDDLQMQQPQHDEEAKVWPVVELVRQGTSKMPRRTIAAIIETFSKGARSLVLLPRVSSTESGPGPAEVVDFLKRVVPLAQVARADRPSLGDRPGSLKRILNADVIVATEAALAEVDRPQLSTTIALSADSYLKKQQGRAIEDTFATLWNLAALVAGPGSTGRLFVETSRQDHHVMQALVRGDYDYFVKQELDSRRESQSPPFVRLARLRFTKGEPDDELIERLKALPGTRVLGPSVSEDGAQILLKIEKMDESVEQLGHIVREASQRILIEVDPRDW